MNYEGLRHVNDDDLTDAQRAEKERHQTFQKQTIEIMDKSLNGTLDHNIGARALNQTHLQDAHAIARMNQDMDPSDPAAILSFKKIDGDATGGIDA